MPKEPFYYSLTVNVQGATSTAYYELGLATEGAFIEGGATIFPTQAAATLVTVYSTMFALNVPAASFNGSVTIKTSANVIAGKIVVSPAINADTVLGLYGAGKLLGEYMLKAGQTSGNYSFNVKPDEGTDAAEAHKFLASKLPRP